MSALIIFLLTALAIWFWLDSARARELATAICEHACRERGVQFLDQTVALTRIGLRWTSQGLRIWRLFRFEFSEEGVGRHSGHIAMTGIELQSFSLGLAAPENNVIPFKGRKAAEDNPGKPPI